MIWLRTVSVVGSNQSNILYKGLWNIFICKCADSGNGSKVIKEDLRITFTECHLSHPRGSKEIENIISITNKGNIVKKL